MAGTSSLTTSVVVPTHNDRGHLIECLSAVDRSSRRPFEVIVVDDASTDDSAAAVEGRGVNLLRLDENSGPAAARNHGARHAKGDVVLFIDADVVVAPDAIERVTRALEERPELAAVFGSYDANPRASGLVSQYRNLLHHFTHQAAESDASTFWAGCGAIRRSVFEAIGGFDQRRYRRSSIEDIELGYRLRAAGHRILLDKGLQGTHLKQWTLGSMLETDIFRRAIPWSRLILERGGAPEDLNLQRSQRLSAALLALAAFCALLSPFRASLLLGSAAAIVTLLALNYPLFAFFARRRGLRFALACIPLHLLYYLYSGLTYLYAWFEFQFRPRRNLTDAR